MRKSICPKAGNFDDKELDRRMDLANSYGESSVWSVFEVVDNMKDVAYKHKAPTLVYSDHWGNKEVSCKLPPNPTWKQLAKAADKLIKQSRDEHHVYVEDFFETKKGVLELSTGS